MQRRAVSRLAALATRAARASPKELGSSKWVPALGCVRAAIHAPMGVVEGLNGAAAPSRTFASDVIRDNSEVWYPEVEAEVSPGGGACLPASCLGVLPDRGVWLEPGVVHGVPMPAAAHRAQVGAPAPDFTCQGKAEGLARGPGALFGFLPAAVRGVNF